jgi:hypothetical protein
MEKIYSGDYDEGGSSHKDIMAICVPAKTLLGDAVAGRDEFPVLIANDYEVYRDMKSNPIFQDDVDANFRSVMCLPDGTLVVGDLNNKCIFVGKKTVPASDFTEIYGMTADERTQHLVRTLAHLSTVSGF